MPIGTLVLAGAGITGIVLAEDLEPHIQFYALTPFILGTPLLLVLWLMFFSGLRWSYRFALLACGIVALVGLGQVVRHDGSYDGSGMPRFVLIWTPRVEARLADLQVDPQGRRVEIAGFKDTDYPRFLGRNSSGEAYGVRLVRDWKTHPPKELWRTKIGLGWSAFAAIGDYAVTQEQREDKELVVCYELKTGKVRWKHEHDARFHDTQGGHGPRATPTIFGDRIYTLGGTGILDCIDGATGKNLWSRDTLAENGLSNVIWGKSCSPLVFDDLVVVTGGQEKHDSLLAYNRMTGQPLWKAGGDDAGYSSPALAVLAGTKQILCVNAHSVTSHDPKDGTVLWDFAWPGDWPKASQPVPLPGDRVFVSAGYGLGCVLLHIQCGSDGQWQAEPLWATRGMRTQFSNVVIAHNCAFGLDDRFLACVDLETGERKWKGARYKFGQVLLVGDLLVVQAEDGYVALVEANPYEFKELGRLPALTSKTWNNPVVSGPYLLVRNDREAVCYELPVEEADW
jgi:outer membrane protein assembly factor BamB